MKFNLGQYPGFLFKGVYCIAFPWCPVPYPILPSREVALSATDTKPERYDALKGVCSVLVPSVANSILLPNVALARSVMLIHSGVVEVAVFGAAAAAPSDDAGVLVVVALVISALLLLVLCQTLTGDRWHQ